MPSRLGEFFAVWILTSLSPGPAALIIMALSLQGGMPRALRGLLGIMAAHGVLFLILWSGLQLSSQVSAQGLVWVQRLGAFYLVFVGAQLLLSSLRNSKEAALQAQPKRSSPFVQAFFTQLFNPKAILFTLALLPGFLDNQKALLPQILVLACIMLPIDFVVLSGYAWLAARGAASFKKQMRWVDGLAGAVILYVGIHLILLIR